MNYLTLLLPKNVRLWFKGIKIVKKLLILNRMINQNDDVVKLVASLNSRIYALEAVARDLEAKNQVLQTKIDVISKKKKRFF
jgi:hypothetical protein